jgi:glycosyltransferase involved in cell wall biosynthesis
MAERFSIVIPTLDRKLMLLAAIESVRAQRWSPIDIIVVDGGSTDGTLEALERMPDIRLVRGPDRGVYDALNKGIKLARGDIVGLLNSDDFYEPGAFAAVARAFAAAPNADAVCGTSILIEDNRTIAVFDKDGDKTLATPRPILIGNCTPNARFFRPSALERIGPFSLDYRYVADRDWLARFYDAGLKTLAIPDRVYRYRQHPESMTFGLNRGRELEIRSELLRLARRWRLKYPTNAHMKKTALFLEGRCLTTLLIAALRHHDTARALRRSFKEDGYSHASVAIVLAAVDYAVQRLRRPLRTDKSRVD